MKPISDWRVLVVEDEPDGQEVLAGILSYFNVATDQALNAEKALEYLSRNDYTAAVIDLALPGMDGLELLNIIRSEPALAHLPCVAITAFHSSTVKRQALEAGFDAYFSKPLDDTAFVRELERVISDF